MSAQLPSKNGYRDGVARGLPGTLHLNFGPPTPHFLATTFLADPCLGEDGANDRKGGEKGSGRWDDPRRGGSAKALSFGVKYPTKTVSEYP